MPKKGFVNKKKVEVTMVNTVFVEQDNLLNPLKGVNVNKYAAPVAGDLDGDGDEDILVGDGSGKIFYFGNEGSSFTKLTGNQKPFVSLYVEGGNATPAISDWDLDGDQDILVGNNRGKIEYFRNDEDSFTELTGDENPFDEVQVGWYSVYESSYSDYSYYYVYHGYAFPTVIDFDGDGDEDLLVGDYYGQITYFRRENPFDLIYGCLLVDEYDNTIFIGGHAAPAGIDVDGDGWEDVLIGNEGGSIVYYHNDGDSFTFLSGSENPFKGVNVGGFSKPTKIDADSDGDEDVLVGNSAGEIKYFENLTIDVNDPPITVDDSVGIDKKKSTTIDVLENDFDPEKEAIYLLEFEENTERSGTVKRDDNGTPEDLTDDKLIYTPPVDFSLNETDSFTYTITDSNNQETTATVSLLAIPIFQEHWESFNTFFGVDVGYNAALTVGDLDGDGDEDLLVGNYSGYLQYFRNEGDSFIEVTGSENPFDGINATHYESYGYDEYYGFAKPAIGDLDGDGDEDVLVGAGNFLNYFRNEGDNFKEATGSENPFEGVYTGWNATPPTIGDLDGDGDEDVLIGNWDGKIKYFRNEGASFIEVIGSENPFDGVNADYYYSYSYQIPVMGDVDEDGDEDVLVGNESGYIKYFRNEGDSFIEVTGSKNPFDKIVVEYDNELPTLGDINGDGDEDLLVTKSNGEIKYFENLSIDVNEPPIAVDDSVGISKNNSTNIIIDVLENDFDPEKEAIYLLDFEKTTERSGTVKRDKNGTPKDLTDDKLIYTPPADLVVNETDSFTYTITDSNNQKTTATVNILSIPIFQKQNNSLNPFKGVDVGDNAAPTVGDLDGDGDEDLLVVNDWGDLEYFKNNGDNFTQLKGSKNPFNGVDVDGELAIGDLNNDGDEDLLIGGSNTFLTYFRNYGDGWAAPVGNSNPFHKVYVGYNPVPAIGDLDGDGDEDVLVSNSDGKIQYFRNEGGKFIELLGNKNPFDGVNVPDDYYGDQIPVIVDLDSDGNEDVLIGTYWYSSYSGYLRYFRNEEGNFTELLGSENPFDGVNVGKNAAPTALDVDFDGDKEVLIGNESGKIKYFENLSIDVNDPPIATDNSIGISKNQPKTINVLKNDLEPEGEPIYLIEFETTTEASGTVERDNNKTPKDLTDDKLIYTPSAEFSVNETDSFTYTITDSNNQTATATVNILAIPIFEEKYNNLNPFFGVDVGYNAAPTVRDLDGDGDEDLLVGNSDGEINYFRNDGDGFTQIKGFNNPFDGVNVNGNAAPTVLDIDGDGDDDLLVGNKLGKLKYFRNEAGKFIEISGSDNPFNGVNLGSNLVPTVLDVDGDGSEDILVGDDSGYLTYFHNDGGNFTQLEGSQNPFKKVKVVGHAAVTALDVDGDGDEDLLVGNASGKIKYFRNDGGSFIEPPKSQNPFKEINADWKAKPTVFDVDGDGDEDFLIGNKYGKIEYFENLTFDLTPVDIITGTPASDTFVLGDLNSSFYANKGEEDYGLIKDFDTSLDIIQLKETAEKYQLGSSPIGLEEGTAIFLNSTELIGIVEGVSGLNIEADYFSLI